MLTTKSSAVPNPPFEAEMKAAREDLDRALEQTLRFFERGGKNSVVEAIRYSLMLPSKRLRPLLCLETCRGLTGSTEAALPAAVALEMIHSYSLVHDDLPSMDNDDLRRGKPTNHKVFGEAMAILAGDGLLTQAFEVLVRSQEIFGQAYEVSPTIKVAWVQELAKAAGVEGMVWGQAIDMETLRQSSVGALESLHRKKTGALIAASVAMGAMAAGANQQTIDILREFALDLGLAFQIQDDVLDVTGGVEMGKPVRSDERNEKPTYVSVLGLDGAKQAADDWYRKSLNLLGQVEFQHANSLEKLARFVVERQV
jgi:geranylgeranyl pyrophosphate synthase